MTATRSTGSCRHTISNATLGRHSRLSDKLGYNKDAIFIWFNDFGSTGQATIATIDKAAALAGHAGLFRVDAGSPSSGQCRRPRCTATRPAVIEWFFSTDGTDLTAADTMRVTEMTNYPQHNPTYTYHVDPGDALQAPVDRRPARRHLDHCPEHDDLRRSSTATASW